MSSLKIDKIDKEKRHSFDDNDEIQLIFKKKLEMQESIKAFISMKVNHELRNFESKIADELINRFLDDLDQITKKMIQKIEKN